MTTITHSFSSAHSFARQPVSHGFWSGAGIGLAVVLVVLTFAAAGVLGGARTQSDTAWQTPGTAPLSGGFENSVPPQMFPLTGDDFATSY